MNSFALPSFFLCGDLFLFSVLCQALCKIIFAVQSSKVPALQLLRDGVQVTEAMVVIKA